MSRFANQGFPITDPSTQEALDQDVLAPLQGLTGGIWGLGVWRTYSLSSLRWSTDTVGSTLTVPQNLGTLGVCRLGENTMLFSIKGIAGFLTVQGAPCGGLQVELPDGLYHNPRQLVGGNLDQGSVFVPACIFSPAGVELGYIVGGASNVPSLMKIGRVAGVFATGGQYNVGAQWAMEISGMSSRS